MSRLDKLLEDFNKKYISLYQLFSYMHHYFERDNDYQKIATFILETLGENIKEIELFYTRGDHGHKILVENSQHLENILKSVQDVGITYLKYSNLECNKELLELDKMYLRREQIKTLDIYMVEKEASEIKEVEEAKNESFSIYGHTSIGISILADIVDRFWKNVQLDDRNTIPSVNDIIDYIVNTYPNCSKELAESIQRIARPEEAKKGGRKKTIP